MSQQLYGSKLCWLRLVGLVGSELRLESDFRVKVRVSTFSALMLLVGCQEGHPDRKNLTDEVHDRGRECYRTFGRQIE